MRPGKVRIIQDLAMWRGRRRHSCRSDPMGRATLFHLRWGRGGIPAPRIFFGFGKRLHIWTEVWYEHLLLSAYTFSILWKNRKEGKKDRRFQYMIFYKWYWPSLLLTWWLKEPLLLVCTEKAGVTDVRPWLLTPHRCPPGPSVVPRAWRSTGWGKTACTDAGCRWFANP